VRFGCTPTRLRCGNGQHNGCHGANSWQAIEALGDMPFSGSSRYLPTPDWSFRSSAMGTERISTEKHAAGVCQTGCKGTRGER
jgi:hypothetical protein